MKHARWFAAVLGALVLAGCIPPPAPPPPPPPPLLGVDLVPTDIAWPAPLVVGARVPFSVTVQNIGDTATPANTILDVLVTVDGVDVGWSDNLTVPLAPGESRVQVVNGGPDGSDGLWAVTEGSHNVEAFVNSGSLPARPPISEFNANNNKLVEPFLVEPPGPPRDTIAFVSSRTGNPEIWTMKSDGSQQTQLTNNAEVDSDPTLSLDGTKVAFVRGTPPFRLRVWVVNADGSDEHEVFAPAIPDGSPAPASGPFVEKDRDPTWSPDGTQIAFVREAIGTASGILRMKADGSDPRPVSLRSQAFRVDDTAWSPDGSAIAYVEDLVCCEQHIGITRVDGSGGRAFLGPINFADIPTTSDVDPAWSPDSTRIAFNGRPNVNGTVGARGLWIANADGTNPVLLLPGGSLIMWLPHENRIMFSDAGGNWSMKPDGTDRVKFPVVP